MLSLSYLDHTLANANDFLKTVFHRVIEVNLEEHNTGQWWLSPVHNIFEFFWMGIVLILLIRRYIFDEKNSPHILIPGHYKDHPVRVENSDFIIALEKLCVYCVRVAYPLLVYYKLSDDRLLYLFQPCHLLLLSLCIMSFLPKNLSHGAHTFFSGIFNFWISNLYAPILALLSPDVAGLTQPLEVLQFYVQHFVVILLPLLWIKLRKFTIYRGINHYLGQAVLFLSIHNFLFLPLSIIFGKNINYMMHPPPALRPLGPYWRILAFPKFTLLTLFTVFILIPLFLVMSGVTDELAEQQIVENADFTTIIRTLWKNQFIDHVALGEVKSASLGVTPETPSTLRHRRKSAAFSDARIISSPLPVSSNHFPSVVTPSIPRDSLKKQSSVPPPLQSAAGIMSPAVTNTYNIYVSRPSIGQRIFNAMGLGSAREDTQSASSPLKASEQKDAVSSSTKEKGRASVGAVRKSSFSAASASSESASSSHALTEKSPDEMVPFDSIRSKDDAPSMKRTSMGSKALPEVEINPKSYRSSLEPVVDEARTSVGSRKSLSKEKKERPVYPKGTSFEVSFPSSRPGVSVPPKLSSLSQARQAPLNNAAAETSANLKKTPSFSSAGTRADRRLRQAEEDARTREEVAKLMLLSPKPLKAGGALDSPTHPDPLLRLMGARAVELELQRGRTPPSVAKATLAGPFSPEFEFNESDDNDISKGAPDERFRIVEEFYGNEAYDAEEAARMMMLKSAKALQREQEAQQLKEREEAERRKTQARSSSSSSTSSNAKGSLIPLLKGKQRAASIVSPTAKELKSRSTSLANTSGSDTNIPKPHHSPAIKKDSRLIKPTASSMAKKTPQKH